MDETAVSVRGGKHYLYRAVDKEGKSVAHLLRADCSCKAAQAFFRKAVTAHATQWPRTVNLDGNMGSHRALRRLRREDPRWAGVIVRDRRYLNNIVEQDHRAIKRRCASMLGFESFGTAAITLDGIELAHRIRKGQFSICGGAQLGLTSLKQLWGRALADVGSTDVEPRNALVWQPTANAPKPTIATAHGVRAVRKPGRPIRPRRQARKFSDGDGLYLLVSTAGGRLWRYNYRFNGKQKTLALGKYPAVPINTARVRHRAAWNLLAAGTDPSLWRRELRSAAVADIAYSVDPTRLPTQCSIEEILDIEGATASRAR